MYYVYLIQDDNKKLYVGYSSNLRNRLRSHIMGTNTTTAKFINPKLVYYEAFEAEEKARQRENKLKQYGSSYTGLIKRLGLK